MHSSLVSFCFPFAILSK